MTDDKTELTKALGEDGKSPEATKRRLETLRPWRGIM
jgi:hypothetical protein